ncbi:MAG: hypothetical protein MJY89_07950 [Bacteroidales bacterium]|nr:hypothetical protein [Bacteroidales bacterium]
MKVKKKYQPARISSVEFVPGFSILSGSIVDQNTTVIIPRGQKVDEYDFSEDKFSHDWEIEEDHS